MIYVIDDEARVVLVARIAHRREVQGRMRWHRRKGTSRRMKASNQPGDSSPRCRWVSATRPKGRATEPRRARLASALEKARLASEINDDLSHLTCQRVDLDKITGNERDQAPVGA